MRHTAAPRRIARSFAARLAAVLACVLVLATCQGITPTDKKPGDRGGFAAVYDARTGGDQVFAVDMSAVTTGSFAYELDVRGAADAVEVYLISTNTSADTVAAPRIDMASAGPRTVTAPDRPPAVEAGARALLPDRPHAARFDLPPLRSPRRLAGPSRSASVVAPRPAEVGDTERFKDIDFATGSVYEIPATVRAAVTGADLPYTLAVWVADASWSGGASTCSLVHCVTQPMVDAIAGKFLQAGADNDIYDWITAVFGAPWGDHGHPGVLLSPDTDQIHILLFDIGGDELTMGGLLGFVSPTDVLSFLPSDAEVASNRKLLLYLDSVVLATPEGASWELTDAAPSELVAALAHEFQHLIYYYQKVVRHGVEETERWLTELCSLVAEDLAARRLEIPGPRGVAHTDGSAGEPGNAAGLLPQYNRYNYLQVTDNESNYYPIYYALGAYLVRTYGAELFTRIVQSDRSGTAAVEAAIRARTGTSTTFGQVLANWAVANVLSDDPDAAAPYRYNTGGWTTTRTAAGVAFDLGSINLYHYRFSGPSDRLDGPLFHSAAQLARLDSQAPHSNVYVDLGRHDGTVEGAIGFSPGTQITLVVKD